MSDLRALEKRLGKVVQECKNLKAQEKYEQALDLIIAYKETSLYQVEHAEVICEIADLCLTLSKDQPFKYLKLAHNTLSNWVNSIKFQNSPVPQRVLNYTASIMVELALHYNSKQKPKKATFLLKKALKVCDSLESESNLRVKARLDLSSVYISSENFKKAKNLAEEALSLLNSMDYSCETNCRLGVLAFYNIAVCHRNLDNYEEMIRAYKSVEALGTKYLGGEDPLVKAAQEFLPTFYYESIFDESVFVTSKNQKQSTQKIETSPRTSFRRNSTSVQNLSQVNPEPTIKRYYSKEQLNRIYKQMQCKSPQIVTADQFFFKKLRKQIDVENDIHYLKKGLNQKEITQQDTKERMKITELRMRKRPLTAKTNQKRLDGLLARIDRLQVEADQNLQKQQVKMASKLKTKVYKNILRNINSNSDKRVVPHQRLYFKPPSLQHSQSSISEVGVQFSEDPKANLVKQANSEIEKRMEEILQEMKSLDQPQNSKNSRNTRRLSELSKSLSSKKSPSKTFLTRSKKVN